MESSPDNDGTGQHCQTVWVRQARREGVREKPAFERLLKSNPPARIWQIWAGQQRASASWRGELLGRLMSLGREATVKACGVVVARLQGHSWAPNPSKRFQVNVGTIPAVPSPASMMLAGGKARRRLMPPGWDGGPVVVAGARPAGGGKAGHMAKGSSRFAASDADRGGRW